MASKLKRRRRKRRIAKDQSRLVKKGKSEMVTPALRDIELKREKVSCPFCLYTNHLNRFYIPLKGGRHSEKRFKCPDCGQTMLAKTLTRDIEIEELARWLYEDVILFGGYDRISWEKLKTRLKESNFANRFWNAWRAVKEKRTASRNSPEQMQEEKYRREFLKNQRETKREREKRNRAAEMVDALFQVKRKGIKILRERKDVCPKCGSESNELVKGSIYNYYRCKECQNLSPVKLSPIKEIKQ